MGVKVTNNAFGTLSAGINTTVTTLTLDSGQGARFPSLAANEYFYGTLIDTSNNIEIVKVTARSTDSMTVVRGQDNTTAGSYAIGDRFELRPVAALFEDIVNGATVVSDTTPQLGGDLDTNGNDINFGDNDKAVFGVGTDLQIYHTGTASVIHDNGVGNLVLRADGLFINNAAGTENMVHASQNGAVSLYHDNSKKLETTSSGITVSGTIKSTRGIVQVVTNRTNVAASGNPVNTYSEINSNYRVTITPQFSDSRLIGMFHIPINPTGASNILMTIAPWVSTNGGTTKTIIGQGNTGISGSTRLNQSVAFFRSSNGFDTNDMQNHVVMFTYDPSSTTAQTFGFFFRSEGANTTYFNHSNGNNGTWGWVAPMNLIMQEVRT